MVNAWRRLRSSTPCSVPMVAHLFQPREKAPDKWQNAAIAGIYRICGRNNSCANPGRRDRKFLPLRAFASAAIVRFCVMGFRPTSERLGSLPASYRVRVIGMSGFFLVLAMLLLPFVWGGASAYAATVPGFQVPSFLALDMSNSDKIDAAAASEPDSADVRSKIEAIRRMGGRSLSRADLAMMSVVGKPAEFTENPVRIVTKCCATQALINEGLGRAPPRFDL